MLENNMFVTWNIQSNWCKMNMTQNQTESTDTNTYLILVPNGLLLS